MAWEYTSERYIGRGASGTWKIALKTVLVREKHTFGAARIIASAAACVHARKHAVRHDYTCTVSPWPHSIIRSAGYTVNTVNYNLRNVIIRLGFAIIRVQVQLNNRHSPNRRRQFERIYFAFKCTCR